MIERQEHKTQHVLEQQNRVKDGIRATAINDVVFVLQQVLQNYQVFEEETVDDALEVMAQLIDWNALEVFGSSVDIFKEFLKSTKFRTNALSCIHAFVHKGMDYP